MTLRDTKNKARALMASIALSALLMQPFGVDAREVPKQPLNAQETSPNESDLTIHGHYLNKDGQIVHSPSKSLSGKAPAGASAQCRDGSYSFSRHRSGTCSHHGGVAGWL